jgi:NADH-quinone oxidoreductase subunit H
MNVGILYIFAISSLGVYGVIMGGWASNSKYPFLGGLRSAAQMVSYEVSIGLIIVGVLIVDRVAEPVGHRARAGRALRVRLFSWYWLPHLPMVVLFFVVGAGGDQPPALRPARGGIGAGGGVSGGVFLDAVPAVHDRANTWPS